MKRYLYILTLGLLFSFISCIQEDITIDNGTNPSSKRGIQIIGASEDFDIKNVGTRADDGVSDSFISEMTMLIFKENGNMLPAFNALREPLKSSHINIRRSNPTFLIETSKEADRGILASMEAGITAKYYDNTKDDIGKCSIYIIANAYHLIGERLEDGDIKTLNDLKNALLATNIKLDMPYDSEADEYIGLPMIGCARDQETNLPATFDLKYHTGESNNNAVATIPLKKLYSKINFTIQVNSKQLVTGQIPEFKLDDVEVFNVPSKVYMDYKTGDYITNVGNEYMYRYVNDTEKTAFSLSYNEMMPSDRVCRHSSSEDTDDVVAFHFFMPEHKVTPNANETTFSYPANLPIDNRQYFKPKLIKDNDDDGTTNDKIATFVRIHGTYTDHNSQIHDVTYDIYLGQDNTDDFEIKRNQLLDNKLIITGITNHKDAYSGSDNTISIDHRVSMREKGYILSMEREAILDSHFEVRPLDIELQPGSSMQIVIPEAYKGWIAMEDDASADTSGKYVGNTYRHGVRKYFTTTLVDELWGDNKGTLKITNKTGVTEIHRIWFYIDENPNVYDKLLDQGKITSSPDDSGAYRVNDNVNEADKRYRVAKVNFYFAKDGDPDPNSNPTATINFQQWNLWRVWSADGKRYYDIEHEEEYLNNYASDAQYGGTQNGMPFGLEGIQLSNKNRAAVLSQENEGILSWLINNLGWIIGFDSVESMANEALSKIETYYDFYLTSDVSKMTDTEKSYLTIRDYSGHTFNKDIATTLKASSDPKAKIDCILLTEDPLSAFAYCYHKNKRNADGTIDIDNIKWFLPAIDEIEDIALGAYDEFDRVFQNQMYWSCQPAYEKRHMNVDLGRYNWRGEWKSDGTLTADYYVDDTDRARATSVYTTDGTTYTPISSGVTGYFGTQNGKGELGWQKVTIDLSANGGYVPNTINDNYFKDHLGNLPRTQNCRIRAVYRSGTK